MEVGVFAQLESAEYAGGYAIRLRFDDGTEGVVDLADELWGEVFEPLKNPDIFQQFRLEPELNTISWPTGADFSPEFLYEQAKTTQKAIA